MTGTNSAYGCRWWDHTGPEHGGARGTDLKNINDLFEGENFDPDSVNSWVQGVVTILVKDEAIREQVNANSKEQFRESLTIEEAVTNAALDHHDTQNNILEKFFESPSASSCCDPRDFGPHLLGAVPRRREVNRDEIAGEGGMS